MFQPRKAGRRAAQPERQRRTGARKQKKKVSAARRAGRVLYGILVALSAVIVFTWIAVKIIARPPEQAGNLPPVTEDSPAPGESGQPLLRGSLLFSAVRRFLPLPGPDGSRTRAVRPVRRLLRCCPP